MIRLYSTSAFYFALAYPGSNLLSIGQLFTVTLVHQGFHGGEEAAVSASLPLAKRSVLGGLLPESLLYVLKRSGPAAFAAAMVSDSDTPEIIWTHKMRAENLIRQVLQHLGDFPQKLSQYCHVLYDYAPMPPVTYPELRDEMCDDVNKKHYSEVSDETSSYSKQIENIDEEKLKRRYQKLAMKYHPVKNPEGREKFLAIQKAYERLQIWGGKIMIRYRDILELFKYAGYPMLLSAVTVDKDDKNFLSFRWSTSPCCSIRACLPGVKFHSSSCCSLTFIVARCASSLNGEELVRDGGVQLLATLLSRCIQFEAAGSEILEFSGLVPDIVHGTEFELLPGAVDAALQSIANVSVSSELQDALLRAGVFMEDVPFVAK
ncbi:uncharacterized protein DS421_11g348150 [Arachis hypogaea]|nr:uncharacterized protein DS421_11g348150 [Arachis hypogaea]